MTKLPDNSEILRLYHLGLSDREIAQRYGATYQAVNKRLARMGIQRLPYSNTATAILEAAWPADETGRHSYSGRSRARGLWMFLRRRLGDQDLGARQEAQALRFERIVRENNVVLDLYPGEAQPWVWVPREPSDGRMVIRWPEGREIPTGIHREALDLPEEPWS